MTVHKAQGRTVQRVVLGLANRPTVALQLNFAAVFAVLSRIKCSDHLRILYHGWSPGLSSSDSRILRSGKVSVATVLRNNVLSPSA
jgi:hypothetical protein